MVKVEIRISVELRGGTVISGLGPRLVVVSPILTAHEIGSTTTRKLDPENIGVAVGSLSICALDPEICLAAISPPPHCRQCGKRRKTPLPEEGFTGKKATYSSTTTSCG